MKRMIWYLVAIMALTGLSGCGQSSSPQSGFTGEDLSLTIDGAVYRCNGNIEQVLEHLGEGYEYAEGMSCDYDGLDKTYTYDLAVFYTNPLSEGDLINEIFTRSDAVSTTRGISVGASRADVLAAYGEECEDLGDLLIYRADGERAALCFDLVDDKVQSIYLTTQPV